MFSKPSYFNQDASSSSSRMCLLQLLLRFPRKHRSEWADSNIDAYSARAIKADPFSLPGTRLGGFGGQVILLLAHAIKDEEAGLDMLKTTLVVLQDITHR